MHAARRAPSVGAAPSPLCPVRDACCARSRAGKRRRGGQERDAHGRTWARWGGTKDLPTKKKKKITIPSTLFQTTEPAKHYGVATALPSALPPSDGLAFQYELKLADGVTCGGAYFKLVSASPDFTPAGLVDTTPFSIMFGPDKCGATNKVHLILRHAAPNGTVEEKHLVSPPLVETDKLTHTYTLLLHPANSSYDILVDGVSKKAGLLAEDFDPPFVPPKEIDDPKDTKPANWVDVAR